MEKSGLNGPALLFCPADRPDRFEKAVSRSDTVILDLEDAVAPDAKVAARSHVVTALSGLDPAKTIVRINPLHTEWGQADLESLRGTSLQTIMLPKTERPEDIAALAPFQIVALCETAAGVLRAPELARVTNCVAIMWGGEDLMADLGGQRSRGVNGNLLLPVQYARAQILLAAGAAKIAALDSVYLALEDLVGLEVEAREAAEMGFKAKVAIHPNHVPVIRLAFAPEPEKVEWATALLEAATNSPNGVFRFRGQMVDGPLLAQARSIMAAVRRLSQSQV